MYTCCRNLLKAPSIQTVYSTLRDQTRIIRLQVDTMYNIHVIIMYNNVSKKARYSFVFTLRLLNGYYSSQNDSMASIIEDMKKLRLIPKSWRLSTKFVPSSPHRDSSPSPTSTPHRREDRTPIRPTQAQGREKLRECLESIKKTPVKRVEKSIPLFTSKDRRSLSPNPPYSTTSEATIGEGKFAYSY